MFIAKDIIPCESADLFGYRYYDFYKHGDFVLYENKDDQFAVSADVSAVCAFF